jgi:hypothetical protein
VTAARFCFFVVCANLAILAVMVFLLWNTFGYQLGVGRRVVSVSKPLAIIVLWLVIAIPVTACISLVRRLVRP